MDLAAMTPTGTSSYPESTILVAGDGISPLQIINVDGNDWSNARDFGFLGDVNDAPVNATYVFNVSGTELSINGGMDLFNALGESYDNVLFNFYEATALEISSITFQGSILAPLAGITSNEGGGHIIGTVIANSFSGAMGFHNLPFEATVAPEPVTPVPEPGTLMLLICGLLFLAARMRGPFKEMVRRNGTAGFEYQSS